GPEQPELIIVTTGTGWLYANETLNLLKLKERVGILRIATVSPLPIRLIKKIFGRAKKILFLEEIDPFLETQIRASIYDLSEPQRPELYGKITGDIPSVGELTIDDTLHAVAQLLNLSFSPVTQKFKAAIVQATQDLPPRTLTFCAGCPHRAAYLAIHRALKRNKNKGFVTGDIGCYSLGAFYHDLMRNQHAMGTGVGLASGFGHLQRYGLDDPVIAVIGDSTLFHAGLPALVNIAYSKSNAAICILDNEATAMTGFQPHPGTGINAEGKTAPKIDVEKLLQGIGIANVSVVDPFNLKVATDTVYKAITSKGSHVIIFRRACPLSVKQPTTKLQSIVQIDASNCRGEDCLLCLTELNCPALSWDSQNKLVIIDEALCVGCNVCIQVCPHKAITSIPRTHSEDPP
ncbi:MAG: thiamine pyrophosphate-dependent enzyme, partial [Promethearchaeota archaeon]